MATRPDILIVGQGIAGTLLAWELECAGFAFAIADAGPAASASCAGAGIVNPITGRRLVKSWRVDTLLPAARSLYRALEAELNVSLWRDLRIRRLFADERERRVFFEKQREAALAPFASEADEAGFWIEGGGRVDLPALLAAARQRWRAQGRLREMKAEPIAETAAHALVVDCSGADSARSGRFGFVPWEFSRGELIEIQVSGLQPDVVLNRRQWVLPVTGTTAWVGATHEPGVVAPETTAAGRALLEQSARGLVGHPFAITGGRAGVRVNLPDKRPVAGRHPDRPSLGTINGLAAKGTLLAPLLARQWAGHLQQARAFDPEIAVERFAP